MERQTGMKTSPIRRARHRSWRPLLFAFIALSLLATACSSDPEQGSADSGGQQQDSGGTSGSTGSGGGGSEGSGGGSTGGGVEVITAGIDGGPGSEDTEITIELGDTTPGDGDSAPPRETTVDGSPLSTDDTERLLNRLPALDEADDDRTDFRRPPETRPRPQPGETLTGAFPPPADDGPAEADQPGPLQVLRFQPEGPVDLAPFISVTFNQPMVALSTVDQVEEADVPISIDPPMPGRWLWLGTRTARFEYEPGAIDRIPAATKYTVSVPSGTTARNGATLDEGIAFDFSTPSATVTEAFPFSEAMPTEPVLFIEFDQRVDASAILEVTELTAHDNPVAIRLATDEEILESERVAARAERALPDRWLAIRPVEPLPTDAAVELVIGPDIPSAEGPVVTEIPYRRNGRTYGPLRLVRVACGWGDDCQPGQPFRMEFTNPLDPEAFSADQVSVSPEIPSMRIGVQWNEIGIQGLTRGQTTYELTAKAGLTDVFGQRLAEDDSEAIRVGDANPALFRPGREIATLDPIVADDRLAVTTINNDELDMTVWQVDPEQDWLDFAENSWRIERGEIEPDWNRVTERRVDTNAERNEFAEVGLDLSDELAETGHVVVLVSPTQRRDDQWQNQPFVVWVQRTTLGLDAIADNRTGIARVTDLRSGDPRSSVEVSVWSGRGSLNAVGSTDGNGLAEFALPAPGQNSRSMLARDGDESAILPNFWAERWERDDEVRWYVVDDRGIYKPGETARIKGWVRSADADVPSELSLPRPGGTIRWWANDNFGNEIGSGEAELTALGGFDLTIEIPEDITLGFAEIRFETNAFGGNGWGWHQLRVQEFRRPDFEVTTEIAGPEPRFLGDTLTVGAEAAYFAGGAIAGSPIDWQVSASATSYAPPNWPDFTWGIWVPWWFGGFHGGFDGGFEPGFEDDFFGPGFGGGTSSSWSSSTDGIGRHDLSMTVDTTGKRRPVTVRASATVIDVNRQPISGSTSTLLHPAELYVGLRGDRAFVQAGETLAVDVIVADLDGALVMGRDVEVTSTRLEWEFSGGRWVETPVLDDTCVLASADEPVSCEFTPSEGGRYQIAAVVVDDEGRENLTELTRWVAGGTRPQNRRVSLEQVTLIPDGDSWQPGDTAEVLVQSPFVDAKGLAVITRTGIDRTQLVDFDAAGTAVVRIPITSDDIPGVGVQIEVVGTAPRSGGAGAAARPAFASGQITLPVPPDERELSVAVAPRQARLTPGSETTVDVAVTDAEGRPVADAEMLVVVVDEAVLSLTGYSLRDPLDAFYRSQGGGFVQVERGRSTILLSDPPLDAVGEGGGDSADAMEEEAMADDESASFDTAMEASGGLAPTPQAAPATRSAAGAALAITEETESDAAPIELRKDFDALAVFEPDVTTDAEGRATIEVPLPDNLTRYRVMVVATAEATDAGTGESNITARLPVTVRPTPPRFANFGDRFEFPVVVQNATDEDLDIEVALRSTNLTVDGGGGKTVPVPANDRVEVRFDVAAEDAGTARWQVAASAGEFSDAAEGNLPVYTPATAEAFATYGVVDSGSLAQAFEEPQDVFPQFGGLEITTSSTAISALTDAVIYMNDYRYPSSDGLASRIISIIALDEILDAFEAEELPSPVELRLRVAADVDALVGMQNGDGGFPFWVRGRESIPYNTVQATHALVLARDDGRDVPAAALDNALQYLANIEANMPSWYSPATRRSIGAYALHVRLLAGDRDTAKARQILDDAAGEQLDVAAWLWPVLADTPQDAEIERLLNNRVTETANQATFATSYGEDRWVVLHSDRRTDAIILDALVAMRPDSDLVLKTLNGLLAAKGRSGRWNNVQENSFVLLAGARYFDVFEDVDPDFVARIWLGDTYAVEDTYDGRSVARTNTLVPMSIVADAGDTDIVIERDGDDGRLYYRLGLRYAPTDFRLDPRDQGFVVQRSYEAVDDPADVVRNDDGSWTIRAGARVRSSVTMVADSRRTHVALLDPMPAGFEALNPALATTEPIPQADPSDAATRSTYWWYRWFDHQNLRDDRAEAFSTWLSAGTYEYTWVARATTPGEFVVPPARAEQIYEPEVFGRSANTTVTIIDP